MNPTFSGRETGVVRIELKGLSDRNVFWVSYKSQLPTLIEPYKKSYFNRTKWRVVKCKSKL